VGPHRHDLCITLQGRPAREQLSAGQVKLLATALRLATVRVAAERRGVAPLLVFDDVDAELDGETLGRLLRRLGSATAQAVLSTAHPEVVVPRLGEATVVAVREGTVV
jgi:DNA replication and repair protein RecF